MASPQSSASKNVWWEFVKNNKEDVAHIKNRKERFALLSEMWKNEKAKRITIYVDHLEDLHKTTSTLRTSLHKLQQENNTLKEMITLLQSYHDME
jgi:hypothetical protein